LALMPAVVGVLAGFVMYGRVKTAPIQPKATRVGDALQGVPAHGTV